VVVALRIAVLGAVSIYRMSTDIFPEIDVPVVSAVWQFTGMPADEIETRVVALCRTSSCCFVACEWFTFPHRHVRCMG
jgi:Cu/Ag efflux pump CusA